MKFIAKGESNKSKYAQQLINLQNAFISTTFLKMLKFMLGITLLTFLGSFFYCKKVAGHQASKLGDTVLKQKKTILPSKDCSPGQEKLFERGENLTYDLASSGAAHTAQLTLISIFLGAIVGALFVGLPQGFFSKLWNWDYVDLDLRALATFLAAIDLWMKYSWGIIVVRWPFSLLHNLVYSLVSGAMLGLAMSVADLNAWLAWGAATCFASFLAYMVNMYTVFREKRHRERHAHKPIASEDPPHSAKDLTILRNSSIGEALFILLLGIPGFYGALNNYYVLPTWLQWRVSFPPGIGWGEFVTLFIAVDILVQGLVVMPKQRYGHTTSSNASYYYDGGRKD